MDALADILETVHLSGSIYCRSELTAPWGMQLPAGDTAQFHVVRRGRCWLILSGHDGGVALHLEAGDIVMVPQGNAHILADDPATPAEPIKDLIACHLPTEPCGNRGPLAFGGGGEPVTLICGYFTFNTGAVHPLLSVLPEVVHVPGEGGRARRWMESSLDLICEETRADRPGREALVNRLTETLFIQVVRAHLEDQGCHAPSWLAGLRDPQIALALGLIHREPSRRWSVNALAARVGMSRSAFFSRFRSLVGEPPLQYLTRWRMQVAASHLQEERLPLSKIAEAVGYETEASFSKVFKRFLGVPPGVYRRHTTSLYPFGGGPSSPQGSGRSGAASR